MSGWKVGTCTRVENVPWPPSAPTTKWPVWAENANELPSHYFRTDLVGDLAPGNTVRKFAMNTLRECLNLRGAKSASPHVTDGAPRLLAPGSHRR